MKCLDLFIFHARAEGEGISNSLLEAMACGLPIVASDIEANRSLLTDSFNGYLYHQEDFQKLTSIITMLNKDTHKPREIGKNARKTILDNYAIESVSDKYINLYKDIVDK